MLVNQKDELRKTQQSIAKQLAEETVNGSDTLRWSQSEIATLLGVSQPTVAGWLKIISIISDDKANNSKASPNGAKPPKPRPKKRKTQKLDADGKAEIVTMADKGTTQAEIAAEFKISQGRVAQVIKQVEKEKASEKLAANPPSGPTGTYQIILCDPPWKYDFAETANRKIENQYPTMTVDEDRRSSTFSTHLVL